MRRQAENKNLPLRTLGAAPDFLAKLNLLHFPGDEGFVMAGMPTLPTGSFTLKLLF